MSSATVVSAPAAFGSTKDGTPAYVYTLKSEVSPGAEDDDADARAHPRLRPRPRLALPFRCGDGGMGERGCDENVKALARCRRASLSTSAPTARA